MKLMTRAACLMLALLFLPALAPGALGEADEAQLTLFVYITGSDLESGGGAATSDITEMLRSGVDTSRVNILLMTGGSRKWWGGFPNDKVCIWQATGARPTQLWQSDDMANLGGPDMLSFFLNYGCENFPAQQYALILWDHGGGPLEGVCYDELYSSDSLSMAELSGALEASPFGPDNQLEWIGFDACLMASVETASVCAPYAKYMIASQETEPGTGWNYSFLKGLEDGVDGAEVGRRVVDAYFDSATETTLPDLTLACVELSKVENIRAAMDAMFGQLDSILSAESFSMLSNSRRDTRNFGRATTGSDYDLVDLYNLAQQYAMIAPGGSDALLAAVEDAVVYQRSGSDDSYGLSVYYPYYNKDRYTSVWGSLYSELRFSEGYNRYLSDYAALWLGESMADWQGLRAQVLPTHGVEHLTIELTPEQVDHYAWAELHILGEFGTGNAYYDICKVDDVTLDTQDTLPDEDIWSDSVSGLLSADYEYQALYVTDEEGNLLTDALPYTQIDDTYLVRAALSDVNGEEDFAGWANDEERVAVYLTCKLIPGTEELQVIGAIDLHAGVLAYVDAGDVLLTGKQTLDPADWEWIQFVRRPILRTEAEDGSVLPCTDWPDGSEVTVGTWMAEYYSVDNGKPWTLKFCRAQNSGRNLWAQYIVVDTQGERFASELLPIENPNLVGRQELNQMLVDDDSLEITLDSIELMELENAGGYDARKVDPGAVTAEVGSSGMYLRLKVKNNTNDDVRIEMRKLSFDHTAISYTDFVDCKDVPWIEYDDAIMFIPQMEFPMLREARIHELSFELMIGTNLEYDSYGYVPVQLDVDIDLGNMVSILPENRDPMAETVKDDVTYQLLTLEEADDGSLTGGIRVINESADDVELEWYYPDCAINDCAIGSECWGEDFTVPAGCDLYTRIGFYSASYVERGIYDKITGETYPIYDFNSADPRFSEPNSPLYWGIDEVRKLSVRAFDAERLDFMLDEPMSLRKASAAHGEQVIFGGDGVSACLREIAVVEDQLRLYLTVHNDAAVQRELDVSNLYINGNLADAYAWFEGDNKTYFSSCEIPPELTFRVALEFDLENLDLPDVLRDLTVNFVCKTGDEDWQYTTPTQIRPKGEYSFRDLEDTRLTIDELEVTAGETGVGDDVLLDPMDFLNAQLQVPEDMSQYRVTLGARIPQERVADFQRGFMVLFVEGDPSGRVYYVQLIPEVREDGLLLADYDGLLVSGVGAPDPLITYGYAPDGDGVDVFSMDLFLESEYVLGQIARFGNVNIHIDLANNSARVQSTQFQREVYESERFGANAGYVHMRKIPTRDERGELKFVDDWDTGGMHTGNAFPLIDGHIQLELRPARDCGLQVFFSVLNKDGSGYSLEPMTYEEAIVDDVE